MEVHLRVEENIHPPNKLPHVSGLHSVGGAIGARELFNIGLEYVTNLKDL